MKFGDRLKNARTEMNLTQEQVANDFFITRQTISSWENEKTYPDIASLIKLSDYYHISLDTLLKEDSGMKEYLEKKSVEKSILPIFITLIIIDLLFITLLILKIVNVIQFSNDVVLILNIFGTLNAIALLQLSSFKIKLGTKSKKLITNKKLNLGLGIGGILLIAGMLFRLLTKLALIGGILTGMGFAILVIYLFLKMNSKSS
ncbi:MAG: helix-turn-helix transcriptional regulator [Liquorilactobacillus hordei]|uniref:HTH cro/C1-type domain-containing protein n=1 Tax=Liquorilactobacillus hordei TaxID=468911 RepID=A0A3S6QRR6_9LACO|nr:helix-turn-helix transcriptional regulator [Liquorilactobacillus hordei]AUJ30758.1 hypothetical protein BSQ49_11515 [Liquorilactobacillus hordei]